jgi:hypothetical protein
MKKGGRIAPAALWLVHGWRSGRRSDVVAFILDPRLASAAARLGSFLLRLIIASADGGWQDAERNSLFPLAFIFLVAASAIGAIPLRPVATVPGETIALRPLGPFAALLRTLADFGLAFVVAVLGLRRHILVALRVILLLVAARTALGLLLVEARAAVFEHAEIVIGVLEVIFGLDSVAGELRVARQALVFFEQLSGVAALAIITGVATGVAGHSLRTLSAAATTTAALTIVDQM